MKLPKSSKLITLPKNYDMQRDGITQSMISNFFCRQHFVYAVNRWYDSSREISSFGFGSLVHDMLERIYKNGCGEPIMNDVIDTWIDVYDFGVKESAQTELIRAKAYVLLTEYIKHYKEDFTQKKFTNIENTFEVMFRGYKLRGKIDGRYKIKSSNWIMENKTKGKIDEQELLLMLSFDFQNLFYITADEIRTRETIKGVLYNIIRNPQSKLLKKERLHTYQERLRKEVQKNPEHYFLRFEIAYTEEDKRYFKYELANLLWEIDQFLKDKLPTYKNRLLCHGAWRCEFLNACGNGTMAGYSKKKRLFEELEK